MLSTLTRPETDGASAFLWGAVGLFSLWGGVVRYLMDKRSTDSQWSWRDIVTQIVISGFTGFLGGFYGYEQHYGELMTLAIAGVSGSLGGSLLSRLWQRFLHSKGDK
jgi:uncharacterized membrane protein YeaQ/YmgE (transglycosylase-associated protein family)